jgi:hypothetical protein
MGIDPLAIAHDLWMESQAPISTSPTRVGSYQPETGGAASNDISVPSGSNPSGSS